MPDNGGRLDSWSDGAIISVPGTKDCMCLDSMGSSGATGGYTSVATGAQRRKKTDADRMGKGPIAYEPA